MENIPRQLLKHSDEENKKRREDDERLNKARKDYLSSQGKFSRYFGDHLTGEQLTALLRLKHAFEIREISGNARSCYDGVSIQNVSFGSKSYADKVIDAETFIKRCTRAVVADVQPFHVSAWWLVEHSLNNDLSPQEAGNLYCRHLGDKKRREDKFKLAVDIFSKCGDAICRVRT